jgi:hypothetical protein
MKINNRKKKPYIFHTETREKLLSAAAGSLATGEHYVIKKVDLTSKHDFRKKKKKKLARKKSDNHN